MEVSRTEVRSDIYAHETNEVVWLRECGDGWQAGALFLADGTVGGLVTAEIMNWTGHVIRGRRTDLKQIRQRAEAARTGIYCLFGTDEEDQRLAYIGQSDNVADRLVQHDAKKEVWDEVVIITSKDSNLTSAHVRYLEARLVAIAQTVGRYRLENGNVPRGGADRPEADASDMDYFIDQIRILLPVLGHDIVRRRVTPRLAVDSSGHAATNAEVVDTSRRGPKVSGVAAAPEDSPVFHLRTRLGIAAEAQVVDGEFTVLAGSVVVAEMRPASAGASASTQSQYASRARLHAELVRESERQDDDLCVPLKDVVFTSPSSAAATVQGRAAANGRAMWMTESGVTYGGWLDSQI